MVAGCWPCNWALKLQREEHHVPNDYRGQQRALSLVILFTILTLGLPSWWACGTLSVCLAENTRRGNHAAINPSIKLGWRPCLAWAGLHGRCTALINFQRHHLVGIKPNGFNGHMAFGLFRLPPDKDRQLALLVL